MTFTEIKTVTLPPNATSGAGFTLTIEADGTLPFAQVIIRHDDGWEWIVKEPHVTHQGNGTYQVEVPPEAYHGGTAYLQVEGCRQADIYTAMPEDWVKVYHELPISHGETPPKPLPPLTPTLTVSPEPVIYYSIHKHMHQPYYNTTDTDYWDGEKDSIFGERGGPYTHFVPTAVWQYIRGGLPHAGLSVSWSGSLIEQLNRCAETGRAHGAFSHWRDGLREIGQQKTALGNPRVEFSLLGYFHPLMPLVPERDIVGQIKWHRELLRETFGVEEVSDILFPPETAFAPHMIPALNEAGVKVVLYDSIHQFRATQEYPYGGKEEGMLPPNPADQLNPAVDDWLQLNNIWAPSKISPQLLKPCILYYEDHTGKQHEIIGVPAERYLGNEDARGGYGALQYEAVMGQIYNQLVKTDSYDPHHPPFFILHSDGDNYGGGADSYYDHNTGRMVEMCRNDPRFQLITIKDYLQQFPVDPTNRVHLEAGSWAGADNGDPQFTKWFSQAEQPYSPDLNSWAILTALQNVVYTLEDGGADEENINMLKRLLYTAETSCYWYWTGQEIWDTQVTNAANKSMAIARRLLQKVSKDHTGPTIFTPWVRPANPGGLDWGNNCLREATPSATFRTFVHDVSGIKSVTLHYRNVDGGREKSMSMAEVGPYPSRTNPAVIATQYQAVLSAGTGNIRYYIKAVDKRGNVSHSPVGRIFIA